MPASDLYTGRLNVLQSFKETTWGTTSAATAKWMGVKPYPSVKPYRAATLVDEMRGNIAPAFNKSVLRNGGEIKFEAPCTYEDMIFLGHGLWGIVAPTGGGPFTYTYNGPTTFQPVIQTYTFEYSQFGALGIASGVILNKLTLKGESEKWWEYTVEGKAKDIDMTASGSPAAQADRVVENILMPTTVFAMDTSASPAGSTAYAGVLTDFTLNLENAMNPVYTAGSLTPTHFVTNQKWKSDLEIGLLLTGAVRTFVNATILAGANTIMQIKATSGTKVCTLSYAGVLAADPDYYGEKDGALQVKLKFNGIYDATQALFANLLVTNNVSAVP